jgi:hypothetical protein
MSSSGLLSIMLFSQARWRHMYCSFQQIFNSLLCCFIILYEDISTVPSKQIFNCLLCCFLNPDEDICTVPSNIYSIVYYVVLSFQMKTYVLFLPTDIQLSIMSFYHSRWRYMYYSLEQIFHLCFASFFFSIKIRTSVLFHSIAFSMIYCVVYSILCFFVYLIVVFVYSSN